MTLQIFKRPPGSFDLTGCDTREASRIFARHTEASCIVDCTIEATAFVYRDEQGCIQIDLQFASDDEEVRNLLFGMSWRITMLPGQETPFDSLEEVAQVLNIREDEPIWNVTNS